MLSNKAKYGLKAMFYLAARPNDVPIGIQEIADAEGISKKFLDAILLQMRVSGMLVSRRGKAGGYNLARPPEQIYLGSIVRSLDGPLAPIPCASRTAFQACADCNVATCRVRHAMLKVRDAIADVLDNTSLADVLKSNAPEALDLVG